MQMKNWGQDVKRLKRVAPDVNLRDIYRSTHFIHDSTKCDKAAHFDFENKGDILVVLVPKKFRKLIRSHLKFACLSDQRCSLQFKTSLLIRTLCYDVNISILTSLLCHFEILT